MYEIGTHNYSRTFSEFTLAYLTYLTIYQTEKSYLKDKNKNHIIVNSYGWKNEPTTEDTTKMDDIDLLIQLIEF